MKFKTILFAVSNAFIHLNVVFSQSGWLYNAFIAPIHRNSKMYWNQIIARQTGEWFR